MIADDWEGMVSFYGYTESSLAPPADDQRDRVAVRGAEVADRRGEAIHEGGERHRDDLEDAVGGGDEVPEAERSGATPRCAGGSREPNTETEFESTIIGAGRCLTRLHTY